MKTPPECQLTMNSSRYIGCVLVCTYITMIAIINVVTHYYACHDLHPVPLAVGWYWDYSRSWQSSEEKFPESNLYCIVTKLLLLRCRYLKPWLWGELFSNIISCFTCSTLCYWHLEKSNVKSRSRRVVERQWKHKCQVTESWAVWGFVGWRKGKKSQRCGYHRAVEQMVW